MLTAEEIQKMLEESGLSRKELAVRAGVNYSGLCLILSGKKKMGYSVASRLEAALLPQKQAKVCVPPDIEPMLRAWAEKTHKSIDALVEGILKEYLDKIKDGN